MDALVIADAKAFVRASDRQKLLAATEETIGDQLKAMTEKARGFARDKTRIEKEQAKLKEAVLKSLMGEGDYSAALLNEMLVAKDAELADIIEKYDAAETAKAELQTQLAARKEFAVNLDTWESRFNEAGTQQKKAMLLNIIDKILVYPHGIRTNYKLETRRFAPLEPIDKPDWLSLPILDGMPPIPPQNGGNGGNGITTNENGQDTASSYANSGVKSCPQATR